MMTTAVATPEPEVLRRPKPPLLQASVRWVSRFARKNPVGAAAGAVAILLILIAVFAPAIAPHAPDRVGFPRLQAPSASHPFGTDNLFRDIFSRIIVGSRISLGIGFSAVAVGTLLGVFL